MGEIGKESLLGELGTHFSEDVTHVDIPVHIILDDHGRFNVLVQHAFPDIGMGAPASELLGAKNSTTVGLGLLLYQTAIDLWV